MNKKATDIVAYLSLVGWLIAWFCGDRENCRFHLNQGLAFALAELVLAIVDGILNGILIGIVLWLARIALFVLLIMALVAAWKGEEKAVPVLGKLQLLK